MDGVYEFGRTCMYEMDFMGLLGCPRNVVNLSGEMHSALCFLNTQITYMACYTPVHCLHINFLLVVFCLGHFVEGLQNLRCNVPKFSVSFIFLLLELVGKENYVLYICCY